MNRKVPVLHQTRQPQAIAFISPDTLHALVKIAQMMHFLQKLQLTRFLNTEGEREERGVWALWQRGEDIAGE